MISSTRIWTSMVRLSRPSICFLYVTETHTYKHPSRVWRNERLTAPHHPDLSLRLPGITMQLMSFWDGQPLRYVLKHRNASKGIDQELLVITFTLIPEEEVEAEKKRWEHGEADGREKEKSQEGVQEKAEDKKTEGYEDDGVD